MARAPRAVIKGVSAIERGAALLAMPLNALQVTARFIRLRFGAFEPRAGDTFIVSYPKSGTTWMQVIAHHVLHGVDVEYKHIDHVVPWFEQRLSIAGNAKFSETIPTPRVFKTHLRYGQLRPPPDSRCIYVVRNVYDTAISQYYHESLIGLGDGSFESFFKSFVKDGCDHAGGLRWGDWFGFQRSWWPHRHDRNVLFVRYEDMVRDVRAVIGSVASLCGVALSPEQVEAIVARSSFEFMKKHDERFDPRLWSTNPARSGGFIRSGGASSLKLELSAEQRADLARRLAALRAELKAEDAVLFGDAPLPTAT